MLDANERFGRLLDGLKDNYKDHMDLSLKVTTTLVVVIGWFVAQKNPLTMLCQLPVLTYIAMLGCAGGIAGVFHLARRSVACSTALRSSLVQLDPDPALSAPYVVNWRLAGGAVATHAVLIVGIALLLRFKYLADAAHTCAG